MTSCRLEFIQTHMHILRFTRTRNNFGLKPSEVRFGSIVNIAEFSNDAMFSWKPLLVLANISKCIFEREVLFFKSMCVQLLPFGLVLVFF